MSFNNHLLRDYIITNFLKEQITVEKSKSLNESELDSFIEMPTIEKIKSIEEDTKIDTKTEPTPESKTETKSQYKYLDDDILSKEFCFNREQQILDLKKYMISLCFFNINEDLKTPFLEFLFDNQTGEFSFPKKELQMDVLANLYKKENEQKINIENTTPFQKMNSISYDTIDEIDDSNEIDSVCDEVEMEFFNQCSKFAQDVVFLSDNVLKERYLGFIEKDDILYIVFDTTNINILENIHTNSKDGYFIGIIDEIINRKKIFETPINEKIINLFESSPLLKNIYDYNNKETIVPKLVYLCVDQDSEDQTEPDETNQTVDKIIEEKPIIVETNNDYTKEKSEIVNTQSPFAEKKTENDSETPNTKEISNTIEIIEKQDNENQNTIETNEIQPIQQKGGSIYKNVYYETEDTIKSQSPITSVINPKINHPLFDNVYLFTSEPYKKDSQKGLVQEFISSVVNNAANEINKIKRFALQIESVKYYKDVDVKTLIEQNEIITPNYDVYSFNDDNHEYWAVNTTNSFTEI
jgi:hypothetical protein